MQRYLLRFLALTIIGSVWCSTATAATKPLASRQEFLATVSAIDSLHSLPAVEEEPGQSQRAMSVCLYSQAMIRCYDNLSGQDLKDLGAVAGRVRMIKLITPLGLKLAKASVNPMDQVRILQKVRSDLLRRGVSARNLPK